jgi:hypothetical protein
LVRFEGAMGNFAGAGPHSANLRTIFRADATNFHRVSVIHALFITRNQRVPSGIFIAELLLSCISVGDRNPSSMEGGEKK